MAPLLDRWARQLHGSVNGWRGAADELVRKLAADQHDLMGELSEGILLLQDAAEQASGEAERQVIEHAIATLTDPLVPEAAKHDVALGPELHETVEHLKSPTTLEKIHFVLFDAKALAAFEKAMRGMKERGELSETDETEPAESQ